MWLLNHLFFHTTAGETEHLPPDQLAAQHTPPRLHPNYQHQSGISPTCLTVYWSHKNWNQFSFFFFFAAPFPARLTWPTAKPRPWKTHEVWSPSEVTRAQERGGQVRTEICGRWTHSAVAEILTGKSLCGDSGGKLSEIISGYRRGTHALQLTSRSSSSEGDRRDSWILPASSACEEAGGWVSSSPCHKIFSFKIFPLLQRGEFTEAPRSPDRQDSTGKPIAPVGAWRHVKWSCNNQLCDWHWQIKYKWVWYWLYENQGISDSNMLPVH